MQKQILRLAGILLVLLQMAGVPSRATGSVVMNYGADGNDYFQFTTPTMAFDKASGFTTLITFAMHVNADGTLLIGGVACTNGVYVGPTNWGSLVATLKAPPTTVTRYEVAIGGWQDTSYVNIESLIKSQGTGSGSMLYKNFQALKKAVPGIDAINDDDELNYDVSSSTSFANLLGRLGYKFTLVPYQNQGFWVNLKNAITNCDYIYLQCYEGGAGNDPGQWNLAFGNGTVVIPGQESNTAATTNWHNWFLETGVQGGFYYPDVVFDSTYWSAAVIEGNGAVPPAPTGLSAAPGSGQVTLSWSTVPGAISYNVKRSTNSGAETNLFSLSTTTNAWPASNQHIDTGLVNNATYFYTMSAVNGNGESVDSGEVSAAPRASSVANLGFETPSIGTGNYRYNPSGATWTFIGASPNGSGLIANGSAFSNPNALQGLQAAFVQEDGTIKQTISGFVPGTSYTISFLAAERPGNAQTWNVTVNGAVIASYNPGSTANPYSEYSATFTAAAAPETVAFVGTDLAGGDNTIFIDDVQIVPTALSASPQLTTNTLPATAADVVGSQVTFTASFSGPGPLSYQWQMISNGITSVIFGATNSTLTLTNLQLANTGSYRLQASNGVGIAKSALSSLTVSSLPAAVNNVITAGAAQTGYGSIATNFVPTWTVAPGSLIAGLAPSSVGGGNFSLYYAGVVAALTDGTFGWLNFWPSVGSSPTEVTCGTAASGAGQSVTYQLPGSTAGYDLTNIAVYGGWGDAGRDQQAYTVSYSTVSAPTTFISLGSVSYLPANPGGVQCATRVTLTAANGTLATNVAAVKFDFTTPAGENGYEGYSEIDVFGFPVPQPVRWAVGDGNWDTNTPNWERLSGGGSVDYVENNLTAFNDSASGGSPITVTLTGNHSPSVLTNNSTKNYILAGNYALTGGTLIKDGDSTLLIDNGGTNGFTSVLIKSGALQVGNNDANGSLGWGSVTNNGALIFERTDVLTISNLISGFGSVTQNGSGTLSLSAVNTYAGNTTVNAGTLALVEPGSMNASALIAVASGATLDVTGRADQTLTLNSNQTLTGGGSIKGNLNALAGSTLNQEATIATLTVQGNITLGGALVMIVNRTNGPASDELVSSAGTITGGGILVVTNLGPVLQAGDVYQLFNQSVGGFTMVNLPPLGSNAWANNLANNGSIAVVSTAAPSLLTQTGAGLLTLAWPADHTGWRLQVQTNSLGQGLGTNWVDVPAAAVTNQISIPTDPNNGNVFYRLTYP